MGKTETARGKSHKIANKDFLLYLNFKSEICREFRILISEYISLITPCSIHMKPEVHFYCNLSCI